MKDKNDVASIHSSQRERKALWRKAIKWPLYSVAIMPIILATAWKFTQSLVSVKETVEIID